MKNNQNVIVVGVQCSKCKDIILSRAHHDYHTCSCKDTAIDGGRSYLSVTFATVSPKRVSIELVGGLYVAHLYDDWNHSLDKLCTFHTKHVVSEKYRYTLNGSGKLYRYPIK